MKTCFVISPIGDPGSDTRKRADQVLKHVIEPAVQKCGYTAERADKISEPGLITSQVIQHIVEDPMVIADLTGSNPNVFYELAVRHAIRKPLVQIIQKGEKIPFDVAGMRTVPVDHKDLDSVDEAKGQIENQIKSVESKSPEQIESPISVSIELQALRQSENPEERSFAEFISAVTELRSDISSIEERLSSPERLLPPNYVREILEFSRSRSPHSEMVFKDLRSMVRKLREDIRNNPSSTKELDQRASHLEEMLTILRHELH